MEDLKKLQVEDPTLTEVRRAADQSEKEGNEAVAEYFRREVLVYRRWTPRGGELNISSGTACVSSVTEVLSRYGTETRTRRSLSGSFWEGEDGPTGIKTILLANII